MPSSADHPRHRQPGMVMLTSPKWRSALARLRKKPDEQRGGRAVLLVAAATLFLAAGFAIAYRAVDYFKSVPEIGPLLAGKLLGMAFLAFMSILLLSNLVTALSTFFLARDLDLLVGAPLDWGRFYLAKLGETIVHSSWMVALLALPLLTAYGLVWEGGWLFPFIALGALIPLCIIPGVIGTAITLLLVNVFPARRTRDLLGLVTIMAAGGLVLMLRLLRPEQLAGPEGFQSLVDFIAVLRTPTSDWLPSEWAAAMVMNWLTRRADALPVALLWSTAGVAVVIGALIHQRLYTSGYARAQEGADSGVRGASRSRVARTLMPGVPVMRREFILKDLKTFFRDSTQWSQLILLGVLVAVYLINIRALPLFTGERVPMFLVTLIVFLNQGLAGFVIAAVAARFIFPSVSLEGRQLWLLRSSPLDPRAMLRSKYMVGVTPLLVLALILTITTNRILQASAFMMAVSIATVIVFTLAVSALALGIGTLYPQYDTENAAQIPTSFGGLVFMLLSIALLGAIIVLEAIPVVDYLAQVRAGADPQLKPSGILAFTGAGVAALLTGWIPLQRAVVKLERLEA
jgi:ABC-2 type transport system permease protein